MRSAGWYQDPDDPSALRWWSGTDWTNHTAPRPLSTDETPPLSVVGATLLLAAPLIITFTAANIVTLDRYWHPLSLWMIGYELLAGPLIGAVLVYLPVHILRTKARSKVWIAVAEMLMVPLIIVVLIAVATDEHSTAGIGLIYIPLIGSAIAAAAAALSRIGHSHPSA